MSPAPLLASTREELADALAPHRRAGDPVALVPTMGALHEGHATLLRTARERTDRGAVVASVFVNPLQFGPGEDLARYPRTLDDDLAVCEKEGVDVVFAPAVDEVYPGGEPLVTVEPGPLAAELEGASRPGHFRGVLTVVAKLFGLTRPDLAVFGEKDYQQLVLVRRMSRDLCLGVDVLGVPTVREADGLALSSRNRFLDAAQRRQATVLSRALGAAAGRAGYGLPAGRWAAMRVLDEEPGVDVDYLAIRTPDLAEVADEHPSPPAEARILVAVRVGATRLIDNLPLTLGAEQEAEARAR
jgi:pantoate--beta-alanine ligase